MVTSYMLGGYFIRPSLAIHMCLLKYFEKHTGSFLRFFVCIRTATHEDRNAMLNLIGFSSLSHGYQRPTGV